MRNRLRLAGGDERPLDSRLLGLEVQRSQTCCFCTSLDFCRFSSMANNLQITVAGAIIIGHVTMESREYCTEWRMGSGWVEGLECTSCNADETVIVM